MAFYITPNRMPRCGMHRDDWVWRTSDSIRSDYGDKVTSEDGSENSWGNQSDLPSRLPPDVTWSDATFVLSQVTTSCWSKRTVRLASELLIHSFSHRLFIPFSYFCSLSHSLIGTLIHRPTHDCWGGEFLRGGAKQSFKFFERGLSKVLKIKKDC